MPASLSKSKAASLGSEAIKYSLQCLRYNSFCPKVRVPQTGCFSNSQSAVYIYSINRYVVYFDKVTDCICI